MFTIKDLQENKALFVLTNRIAFYIPSTDEKGNIPNVQHVERTDYVLSWFARLFGGSTAVNDVYGCWIDSDNKLVQESIKIVYSFCSTEDLDKHYEDIIKTAVNHCQYWNQESIAIEINDNLLLVDSGD